MSYSRTTATMTRSLLLVLIGAGLAFSQTRKEFEVATIKPAMEASVGNPAAAAGVRIDGSQVRMTYLSLRDYISSAYNLRLNQIIGPDWLGTQRFDIAAKLPDGSVQADVDEMMQSLFADRFKMKTHREKRELPVYALEVAKSGLTLQPTGKPELSNSAPINLAAGGNNQGVAIDFGNGAYFMLKDGFEIKDLAMDSVADMLSRFMDRQVVNLTGAKGTYEFKLPLTPEDRIAMLVRVAVANGVVLPPQALALIDGGSTASLSDSLKKVGLTIEARRVPLDVLVVDEIQKMPTEN